MEPFKHHNQQAEWTSLREQGVPGTNLKVTGYILSTDFKPVKHALLAF
jgi:hypothetical protein